MRTSGFDLDQACGRDFAIDRDHPRLEGLEAIRREGRWRRSFSTRALCKKGAKVQRRWFKVLDDSSKFRTR
jgi:hypothetical protein